jgi:sugar phosphate isomerase/epimerase
VRFDEEVPDPVLLTYCGNVHPATDLGSWLALTAQFAVPVAAARRADGAAFGLGTWWNGATAALLCDDAAARQQVAEFLVAHDLGIWTLNVFPHGSFHGGAIKQQVYEPDWADEARVLYTRQAAEAAARLCAPGRVVPMSTLPLAYHDRDRRLLARNLVRAASHLHAMEEAHGVELCLALEPEPFCLLETVAQAAAFLERWVFCAGAWTVPEVVLRRHLGVCVDLCHLAVVREDAVAALGDLAARGIRCPKIQVSACPELRAPGDPVAFDRLLAFDEPVYLHQTVAASGARALDLGEVAARRDEFAAGGVLRTHFHTPVFWDAAGPFGSTRAELERVLRAVPRPLPLLEVETYTWEVLPGAVRGAQGLCDGIVEELRFVARVLAGRDA